MNKIVFITAVVSDNTCISRRAAVNLSFPPKTRAMPKSLSGIFYPYVYLGSPKCISNVPSVRPIRRYTN